mmetsp:Transcript_114731/g.356337  ORF Transcript_114731/g.356337 Transcript_114731/m.356337 type:complete len:338 (-) Transcript_114731:712-1725(-)
MPASCIPGSTSMTHGTLLGVQLLAGEPLPLELAGPDLAMQELLDVVGRALDAPLAAEARDEVQRRPHGLRLGDGARQGRRLDLRQRGRESDARLELHDTLREVELVEAGGRHHLRAARTQGGLRAARAAAVHEAAAPREEPGVREVRGEEYLLRGVGRELRLLGAEALGELVQFPPFAEHDTALAGQRQGLERLAEHGNWSVPPHHRGVPAHSHGRLAGIQEALQAAAGRRVRHALLLLQQEPRARREVHAAAPGRLPVEFGAHGEEGGSRQRLGRVEGAGGCGEVDRKSGHSEFVLVSEGRVVCRERAEDERGLEGYERLVGVLHKAGVGPHPGFC